MSINERIISAIQRIAEDVESIGEIVKISEEYYFEYKEKYWSISRSREEVTGLHTHFFFYYPNTKLNLKGLAELASRGDPNTHFMVFRETDFPRQRLAFRSLYDAIEAKYFGLDDALDDILGKEPQIPF